MQINHQSQNNTNLSKLRYLPSHWLMPSVCPSFQPLKQIYLQFKFWFPFYCSCCRDHKSQKHFILAMQIQIVEDVQMSVGAHKEWVQFLLSVSGCVISAVQSIVPWPVVRNHLCLNGRRLTAESTCSFLSLSGSSSAPPALLHHVASKYVPLCDE